VHLLVILSKLNYTLKNFLKLPLDPSRLCASTVLHEEEPNYVCRFYSRPVVWNRNIQYGIKKRTCEKDKEAGVLQRKPLRKWPRRRSRIAEDKIQIYLREIAYEVGRNV
jgi:hypothetical protein